jgi:hypothetical protein
MSKTTNKKETQQTITIDDKDYNLESFSDHQKRLVNHVANLSNKIESSVFNLEQLEFGKASFVKALKESLAEEEEVEVVEES